MTLEEKLEIPAVQDFYITQMLISPIEKILERLKKDIYDDSSVPYLEENLSKYIAIAIEIKGLKIPFMERNIKNWRFLTHFLKNEYITYFQTLLDCFKKIVE